MSKVLCFLLSLLSVPLTGIATGLAIYYQLFICWHCLPTPQFLLICCLVLPFILLTTPVHEFGHLFAAWWVGKAVMLISLFGIALYRDRLPGTWRLGRTPGPYSSHCVVSMARDGKALRRRHLIVISGGVMMNLLVAILSVGGGQAIFSSHDSTTGFRPSLLGQIAFLFPNTLLIALLNLFAIANVCCIFHSLVLSQPGTPPSDGTQLRFLLREPHVDRDLAFSNLRAWLYFGVRPRDWVPIFVAKLQDPGSAETIMKAPLYLYYYHEDRGEAGVAERYLFRAIELCGESGRVPSALAVEAAYVAGLHHRDAAKAREWLSQVKPEEIEPHTKARAEAAALLAEGQYAHAVAVAELGLTLSRESADPGGAKAERDWLQAILDASRGEMEAKP